jgi:hypothetical protein
VCIRSGLEAGIVAAAVLDRCRLILDQIRMKLVVIRSRVALRTSTGDVSVDLIKVHGRNLFARKIVFFLVKCLICLRGSLVRLVRCVLLGWRLHTLVAV